MRLTWSVLCLVAWICIAAPALAKEEEALEVGVKLGQRAPHFILTTVTGDSVVLADSLGSGPVVLTFWGTRCDFCKKDMPEHNKLHAAYATKGAKFFAISIRDAPVKVAKTAREWGIRATVLVDWVGKVKRIYEVKHTPTVVILDQKGVVRFHGYEPRKKLENVLDELL